MTSRLRVRGGLCLLSLGCTVQSWRPSELQLDIIGAGLTDEDRVRICVDGRGMRESAIGSGRIAFTGLPVDTDVTVTVDALRSVEDDTGQETFEERIGRAGPQCLTAETPWVEIEWTDCAEDCSPCKTPGEPVGMNAESQVLAVRFLD